jgi:hypothetical protein
MNSFLDLEFVRRFGLFGSTWMLPGANPYHNKWGNTGSKIVRAYVKWETWQFRVELELHVGFLDNNGITTIFDFDRLVNVLLPHHFELAKIDEAKLLRALRRAKFNDDSRVEILRQVRLTAERSLWRARRYLSDTVGLENVQRLLVPLVQTNRVIRRSLERLVAQWPQRPRPLRRTP